MSTRAVYTVFGEKGDQPIHIYIHHDGYPTGAADHIRAAIPYAWKLPRFESDEWAAALCAGNKGHWIHRELELLRQLVKDNPSAKLSEELERVRKYQHDNGGGVRVFKGGPVSVICKQACDLEYRYEIRGPKQDLSRAPRRDDGKTKATQLHVTCYAVNYWGATEKPPAPVSETKLFEGTFEAFAAWATAEEAKKDEDKKAAG